MPTPFVGEHDIVFGLATPSAAASSSSTAGAVTTDAPKMTDAPTTTDVPAITDILDTALQIIGTQVITTATDVASAKRRRDRRFAIPLPQHVQVKRHPPVGAKIRRAPQADSTPAALSSRELIPAQTSLVLDFSLNLPRLEPPTPGLLPRARRTRFYPIQQLGALTL